jgi:hypothetical protein
MGEAMRGVEEVVEEKMVRVDEPLTPEQFAKFQEWSSCVDSPCIRDSRGSEYLVSVTEAAGRYFVSVDMVHPGDLHVLRAQYVVGGEGESAGYFNVPEGRERGPGFLRVLLNQGIRLTGETSKFAERAALVMAEGARIRRLARGRRVGVEGEV